MSNSASFGAIRFSFCEVEKFSLILPSFEKSQSYSCHLSVLFISESVNAFHANFCFCCGFHGRLKLQK